MLVQNSEKSGEVLAQSVSALDQRISAMRKLVSEVATRFPIDRDR
jgi:hypothetical protein